MASLSQFAASVPNLWRPAPASSSQAAISQEPTPNPWRPAPAFGSFCSKKRIRGVPLREEEAAREGLSELLWLMCRGWCAGHRSRISQSSCLYRISRRVVGVQANEDQKMSTGPLPSDPVWSGKVWFELHMLICLLILVEGSHAVRWRENCFERKARVMVSLASNADSLRGRLRLILYYLEFLRTISLGWHEVFCYVSDLYVDI